MLGTGQAEASLSFGHQIVTSPISMCSPVYQAEELTTIGHDVLNTLCLEEKHALPVNASGFLDMMELNKLLVFSSLF
uniref:Glycosyltransferase n=1 Tax=Panagrellus redivivus TaxID=6233 RepID=A0A7E4WAK7_PANRE